MDNNLSSDIKITHTEILMMILLKVYHQKYKAFSVQYHPEASPGPHDSKYLFKNFIDLMERTRKSA